MSACIALETPAEKDMGTSRFPFRHKLIMVLLTGVCFVALPARAADDDAALRDKALALNDITGDGPIKGEIKALNDAPATTKKLLAVAVKMAKDKNQPFNYNGAFILAHAAQHLEEVDAGLLFFHICVESATKLLSVQKAAQALDGLSVLLFQAKKFRDCERACRDFLELPIEDANLRRMQSLMFRRLIVAVAKQGKYDEAHKMVDKILEGQPDNWVALELRGQVYREAGKNVEAVKTYEGIVALIAKDKNLDKKDKDELTDLYHYILSSVYVDADQIDKATGVLRELLAKHPDDPTYNNDLGYVLADHDQSIDEAEKMIRKALEEDRKQRKAVPEFKPEDDKDNAAYLDSLGWVLFKKKNYKEAKKYLLEAVREKEGQHIEILDHLGDVHMALGEKADAVAVWKKALTVEPASKREQQRKAEVEKKIKANP
jgi:tetratricopeptide (TPR) repeat protein